MRTTLAVSVAVLAALIAPAPAPAPAFAQAGSEDRHGDEATEIDDVAVGSSRSRRRMQDEPVRVEVLR